MTRFKKHSGIYTLQTETIIQAKLDKVWKFFSDPKNLSRITPKQMQFEITSAVGNKIYSGQIITYKVSIFKGLKSNWVTEITSVKENSFFIDEQRFGPYRMWHHEHHFEEFEEGTKMIDIINYKVPFGFLGQIAHPIIVKPKLKKIFTFRENIIHQLFV